MTRARRLALACMLMVPGSAPAYGTTALPDTSALQFRGFRAGARLDELAVHLRTLGARQLRCQQSKIDPRVHECRGVLNDPELGRSISVWISAMDSMAGVMTLSAVVGPGQLERWRETLEMQYGRVGPRVQGTQWMLQWVRQGRMLRLTWRLDRGEKVASVSLVDGHVLDAWGRTRKQSTSRTSGQPASRTR